MNQRTAAFRTTIAIATTAVLVAAGISGAAPRNMIGSITVDAPSSGLFLTPGVYGKKIGGLGPNTYPPTDGPQAISVAGTAPGTFVGRPVTLPPNRLNRSGFFFSSFPAFGNIAQNSKTFMSVQNAATFANNGGAIADCPGPGCTASGAGTAISWCPPNTHNPAAPAPGTVGAQIGNWDCPSWQVGAGGGDRFLRLAISNTSGRPNFGGTLELIRNQIFNVWRVPGQPSTPNANDAEVTRFLQFPSAPWPGGQPNFVYTSITGMNGPRILARLNANGAIVATFGCVNGIGTVGAPYMHGVVQTRPGNNCGTDPGTVVGQQEWGFKMTTGTVSGSDPYPFGLVVTTFAGSPFNPNFGTQPASLGFFFSRMGTDAITGMGNRNLVLVGGGIAVDPPSGNAFFEMTDLRMNLSVPEPATGLGLVAGAGMLVGLVRRRSKGSSQGLAQGRARA